MSVEDVEVVEGVYLRTHVKKDAKRETRAGGERRDGQ